MKRAKVILRSTLLVNSKVQCLSRWLQNSAAHRSKAVMNTVDYETRGNVALLGVNHPPVNAIGTPVASGIVNGIQRANEDNNIQAIVLYGKGRTFPAGADITEFQARREDERGISDRIVVPSVIESSAKPVVAAIHGTCLGGGHELALGSHYRIAHQKAKLGFPEVELGILPAWHGTQRLPRLIGIESALDIIAFGKPISAQEAHRLGIVDQVVKGDILEEGIQFAHKVAGRSLEGRLTSKLPVPGASMAPQLVSAALEKAKKKSKGMMAPIFCIKSVEAASQLPFELGIKEEEKYGKVLFTSGQARALQYAFFSQRAATKWSMGEANSKTVKPAPLKTGAVIGAGTMGAGIAMCMLNIGMPTILVEQNKKMLEKGVSSLRALYAGSVRLGRMTQQQADQCLQLLTPTIDMGQLSDADIVIEAVYESMKVKKEVFTKLDAICKADAVLCSNTSGLDIDQMAACTSRPESVVGTHFFVPAYYMRLLENIRGAKTSPQTVATVMNFGTKIGKVPVLVGNCRGFVGNRMMRSYTSEAAFLVEEGALPHEVDQVIEDFGIPTGPFKVGDLSGLDIGYYTRQDMFRGVVGKLDGTHTEIAGLRYCSIPDLICIQGRLGRKTGKGWYKYAAPGAKEPMVDEDVTKLILKYCKDNNIQRRKISYQEILERCWFPLINEGFKILEEGIASKPQDIDTVWLLGYGWPRYTGGPMFYANQIGLRKVYDRICHYHELFPTVHYWEPSQLLKTVVEKNVPLEAALKHAKL